MIILAIFMLIFGVYLIYWTMYFRRMNKLTASLPEPLTLPLLGSAMNFMGNSEKMFQNIQELVNLAFQHKGCVKVWLGPKLYVAIANPEDAQVVLDNCLDKDKVYRFLRPWLGHGLFIAPVDLWKTHRKVLLPIFRNKIVEEYLDVISEQANILLERLEEKLDKGKFDVLKYITACTLDIVFETAMGERMDVQHKPDTPYLQARETVITIINKRLFKVWLQPDCLFNLTSYAKQQKDNIDLTHKFTDEVVQKKRFEYEKKINKESHVQSSGKLQAVLDLLFNREIEFTNEELREHIDSITIAGNDTTALVIAYTLVLLGVHQDAQQRVLQEQEAIFDKSKRGANREDLQRMSYLERVVKESMRLYAVVPIIARNIHEDIYLPVCETTLPAGTGAVIGAFAMHRSEAVWGPTANEFDPDRFLPERSVGRHPAAFIPFSYGSRNCIGRNFGMMIIKSILSTVLRSYQIEAQPINKLKMEMLLFPTEGHQIKISKR
ncbi:cytochrome P450 4c3-like [Galleria mellonella]|uniref:Cytochrome P450 4c3-like n=1 Tax=Galleria mellonella TaxID=7137 RepID=A0A6J1WNL7_GALME|nr:cytochrome P450 4c3-like [Galleria mellonella]XP_052757001.1 cytochrome P450 4c3-like [Galleria mellonella]